MELQWLAGMGATVTELVVALWARRAPACAFHLVPVPLDPFALPANPSSDPLRCPVKIPLDPRVKARAAEMVRLVLEPCPGHGIPCPGLGGGQSPNFQNFLKVV